MGESKRLLAWVLVCLSAPTTVAWAQTGVITVPASPEEQPTEPAKPPVLVAPKLKEFAPATFPPAALEQGVTGQVTVELELLVGVDGTVSDAQVKTAAGNGFDEAALEAGRKLIFEPATRDGQPVPARVVFPYVFEIKEAPKPVEVEAPPKPGRLEVEVLGADDKQPIAGAEVLLTAADPQQKLIRRAQTDVAGHAAFDELLAGQYQVHLSKRQWLAQDAQESIAAGEATHVVYRLQLVPDAEAFHAVARIAPPPREVTRRTIGREELTRIPGTRGDALRAVEILPGVGRPPMGAGVIIVRGSAPADTQVLLNGIPVQLLYHFGGLTSFINSSLLESVDFYPGNFSVRYGRRRGGIIEATVADPPRDKLHGIVDLNLIDGSLLAQGPITSNWEFAAAARRSWVDLFITQVLSGTDVQSVAAPVYYDYQAITTYRPGERDKLRLMVYGSSDAMRLLFSQPSDTDAAVSGNLKLATQFQRAHVSWMRKVSDRVDHDLEVAAGHFDAAFGLGSAFDFSLKGTDMYLRSEWRARMSDHLRVIAGLDSLLLPGEVSYAGPPITQQEGSPDNGSSGTAISNRSHIASSDKFTVLQPAVYLETDLDLQPVRIELGTRVDYYSEVDQVSIDPRASAHYSIDDKTRLKGGVGMFSQPPQYQESSAVFGNPHLGPTHTTHTGFGVERDLGENIHLGVEGFYKFLYDRIIGTQLGVPPKFMNGGRGRIYGLEVSAKVNPTGRFFGYLSYTLSRSEREDHHEGYKLFDFDQPHILTLSGVYRLGRGWELGATFRLVSGNPSTPVIGAVYNADTALYSPVYGPLNSIRSTLFSRLDVRLAKSWRLEPGKITVYLDVQNIYNRTNAEGIVYDFDYRMSMPVSGIPIFPNLGLRGEL
ncbi:MAG TPA: TonB-dependent receptor [Polyangiales bacterium]